MSASENRQNPSSPAGKARQATDVQNNPASQPEVKAGREETEDERRFAQQANKSPDDFD
jgi:hypothetical protein